MKLDVILSNCQNTVGFATVTGFEGSRTTVDLKFLKKAIKTLDAFVEKGLTPVKLTIGIEESENQEGVLIFFLDEEGETGIVVASLHQGATD